jgi:hypothetical protein
MVGYKEDPRKYENTNLISEHRALATLTTADAESFHYERNTALVTFIRGNPCPNISRDSRYISNAQRFL